MMKMLLTAAVLLTLAARIQITALAQTAEKQTGSQPAADKKQPDCGCESKTDPDLVAVIDGVNIQVKELDEKIADRIKALQDQVVEARSRELDVQINSRLLEAEAKRLGISSETLLEREVTSKIKQPTEAEAQAFYDQNRSRIQGAFADVKDQIIGYLRGHRERDEAKNFAQRLRSRVQVKTLADSVTPPKNDAERARIFATIDGKPVTSGDIEDALKPLIFSVQEQVYELRKQALDVKINDLLLERESKKRNLTSEQLFDAEVLPRVKPVTEEAARKFYDENKERINAAYEQVHAQVIEYLQNRERNNAESAYAEQLRKGAAVQIFLRLPDSPVYDIATNDRPWKGGASAAVTIVEFTDYECPSCGAMQPILEEVAKEFGDKVKLVARDFPLDQHKHAFKAAEAAEAAREQGKYWEYVAILFKNQKALEIEQLKEYATQLGLDRKRFDAALDSGKFTAMVKRDLSDGEKIGVDSTPSVFVNGKKLREKKAEDLKAAIEAALKDSRKR